MTRLTRLSTGRGPWRVRLVAMALLASLLGACGSNVTIPGVAGAIPRCGAVPQIAAAPAMYRDAPIYVANEMPTDEIRAWADGKTGFETMWIDREHNGWVTVAFSRDAAARQAELAETFPGVGVVAVQVDWTMAELQALQARVMRDGQPHVIGSGIPENYGVVSIQVRVLDAPTVAAMESKFGGQRVCIDGTDPADVPAEGPQQQAGDGWRLLADQDETGPGYRTGIATDDASYAALWAQVGLAGEPPAVDFQSEVAVWFGAVHSGSCPRMRLDDVVVEPGESVLYSAFTYLDHFGACTADAVSHAYVVAVERSKLPDRGFSIRLSSEPPRGTVEEVTIVDADLSVPGAVVRTDQLRSAEPVIEVPRVESGDYMDEGNAWRYRLDVRCGSEWLGELNDVWWRTEVPAGEPGRVPPEWLGAIDPDGTVDLWITLSVEPEPRIEAVAGSHTVTYRPSPGEAPACD